MTCICYDAYFGKVFRADWNNVREKTNQFNEEFKNRGYVFAREYLEYLEDLSETEDEYRPCDYLLDNFGFQNKEGELIRLEMGLLDEQEVVIIRPWAC